MTLLAKLLTCVINMTFSIIYGFVYRAVEGIEIPDIQTKMFLPMRNLSHMYEWLWYFSLPWLLQFVDVSPYLTCSSLYFVSWYFLVFAATSKCSSTALMLLMSDPANPTQTASRHLRTCWLTWCFVCPSGSWLLLHALAICLSLAWDHWFVQKTTCMLSASKSFAVSTQPFILLQKWKLL